MVTSEPSRPHASALPLRSLRRPLSRLPFRRSAWCYAPSLPPFRFRLFAFAPSLRVRLATFPKCPLRAAARRPHQECGAVCHGSCISPRHTPTLSEYEKREAFPPPFGDVKSSSQPVRHGFQRGRIQRLGRVRRRKIEESDAHGVAVLALHDSATATCRRNLRRRRVTVRDSP